MTIVHVQNHIGLCKKNYKLDECGKLIKVPSYLYLCIHSSKELNCTCDRQRIDEYHFCICITGT